MVTEKSSSCLFGYQARKYVNRTVKYLLKIMVWGYLVKFDIVDRTVSVTKYIGIPCYAITVAAIPASILFQGRQKAM